MSLTEVISLRVSIGDVVILRKWPTLVQLCCEIFLQAGKNPHFWNVIIVLSPVSVMQEVESCKKKKSLVWKGLCLLVVVRKVVYHSPALLSINCAVLYQPGLRINNRLCAVYNLNPFRQPIITFSRAPSQFFA